MTGPAVEAPAERHAITKVRREPVRRTLTVTGVERVTPKMLRLTFASPELADFDSAAPDDHIKLFVPNAPPEGGKPCMRDYTPRSFDRERQILVIDFALHDAGPATAWALTAKPGDQIQIGGPRGSQVVPDDFDWYLLIGDETALPAMGRRLEELRPDVPAITVAAVDDEGEAQAIRTDAAWTPIWICRDQQGLDDAATLRRAVEGLTLLPGDGYVWIAAEAQVTKALRAYFTEERRHPPHWMRASGYWVKDEAGALDPE
jgi:NADPH-dependent ferric siderophore reductase